MRAMVLQSVGQDLVEEDRPVPKPGAGQVLLRVQACAVCRTDLHLVDGELPDVRVPVIPGHEIVGELVECGPGVDLEPGARFGVPWLGWTCGECAFCRSGQENLCDRARFTGYDLDGGYAEYTLADHRFCFPLDPGPDPAEMAPLLCAGLIGHRSLAMTGDARRLGLYGFGAAAHIVTQVACWEGREVHAFTRPGGTKGQAFALEMGAAWAGDSDEKPPELLDAAIIFAPVGELVPTALKAVRKGGRVVLGGIHMSDIPSFPYHILWGERQLRSVANLTRKDGEAFFALAAKVPVRTRIQRFSLSEANTALDRLRRGELEGAAVLVL